MLTTLPPVFCASICFTANCVVWIKPNKLVDDNARKSSSVYSVNGKEYVLIGLGGTSIVTSYGGYNVSPAKFVAFALG